MELLKVVLAWGCWGIVADGMCFSGTPSGVLYFGDGYPGVVVVTLLDPRLLSGIPAGIRKKRIG